MTNETLTNSHLDLRTAIMEYAWQEFRRIGIRKVKVDDLSAHFSISKRTLYEMFEDKENLVVECFRYHFEKNQAIAGKIIDGTINSLEIFMRLFIERIKEVDNVNPIFFEDAFKYDSLMEFFNETSDIRDNTVLRIVDRCVDDGYLIRGLNYKLLLDATHVQFVNVVRLELFRKYKIAELINTLNIVFFRGCCTPKGIALIDRQLELLNQSEGSEGNSY